MHVNDLDNAWLIVIKMAIKEGNDPHRSILTYRRQTGWVWDRFISGQTWYITVNIIKPLLIDVKVVVWGSIPTGSIDNCRNLLLIVVTADGSCECISDVFNSEFMNTTYNTETNHQFKSTSHIHLWIWKAHIFWCMASDLFMQPCSSNFGLDVYYHTTEMKDAFFSWHFIRVILIFNRITLR